MAAVGQRFSHALQPVQFSARSVTGILNPSATGGALLAHLVDNPLAMAVLDQLVIAPRLFERDVRKKHDQQHHPHDRDVVGHGQNFEKLL
jgi:hypothetical protein